MGNYHPHGDSAIYDALARMMQPWSMRVPLIDGQGNFGSMDPDPPASMRYTEARLARVANALLDDLDKDTVDFVDNYDGSRQEPSVLPARFPNLLVNGAGGIAVGMATNIPPHNLGEVIDGCFAYMDNPAITSEELIEIIPGPDFPTAPLILGSAGARVRLHHRARLDHHARRHEIETGRNDRQSIVLTSIPYQVGKASLVEKIAEAAKEKRIEGISDIRDESNRNGVRVVIELKRDATAEVVLNQLWRHIAGAVELPGQHAGDPRRPARNARPARFHPGLHPLPRTGHHPADQVRAEQGARPGPHLARPGRRGVEPRRSRGDDPHRAEPGRSAQPPAGQGMADRRHRAIHPPGRGDRARCRAVGRHLSPVRTRR